MTVDRRKLIFGTLAAGAAAPALTRAASAIAPSSGSSDVDMLNVALGLEHEAIYAYTLAGSSGLLSAKAAEVGLEFQQSHEGHRDLLTKIIRGKGGRPVLPAEKYGWSVPLKDEKDVLALAFQLEVGAARAYLSVVPKFNDRTLSEGAARIMSDEVLHATVLRSVLGREVVPSFRLITV
ncbi:MAG TPA: ferritin-like domain-containing protein [Thermoanaerobaculia bacterium]|jgi:rubrerythrin|nr:ferritin-like domain-containing protein [Thermoanaerobaculia bacterium]